MIREIWSATRPTFKHLRFGVGLNIVLVKRTDQAGPAGKRNAAGKSSLIDVIHFLFGGNNEKSSPLAAPELSHDDFKVTIDFMGEQLTITRSLNEPSKVILEGNFRHWPIQPDVDRKTGLVTMSIATWCRLLGHVMFGMPTIESQVGEFCRSAVAFHILHGGNALMATSTGDDILVSKNRSHGKYRWLTSWALIERDRLNCTALKKRTSKRDSLRNY